MKQTRILIIGVLAVAMVFMTFSTPIVQASATPGVLPPTARVQGLTLGEWGAELWRAFFAIPASQHPALGNPWPNCYLDVIGNVGLSVGYSGFGSSNCEMPAGMMLYVVILGSECSTVEPDPWYGGNEAELRACALKFVPEELQASIDGLPVQNINSYTALSPLYQFNVPEDNILGAPAGSYDSVAYDTAFILAPLSPGKHTVHVHGEFPSIGGMDPFIYDWVYYITVTN